MQKINQEIKDTSQTIKWNRLIAHSMLLGNFLVWWYLIWQFNSNNRGEYNNVGKFMILWFIPSVLLLFITWSFFGSKSDAEDRKAKLEEAASIIKSGGWKTSLEKYLFLFPDACRECGCRDLLVQRRQKLDMVYDWREGSDYLHTYEITNCKRCGNHISRKHLDSMPVHSSGNYDDEYNIGKNSGSPVTTRVISTFLTDEEADAIPDFSEDADE